jgi:transposase
VNKLEEQMKEINSMIASLVDEKDVKRISKVPGLGETSASAIIAEIGDPRRFHYEKHLSSYAGLASST